MSLVRDVVESTYRMWLEPPHYQPPLCFLADVMALGDFEVVLGNFALAEDEQLLRAGVLLEVGFELVRVVSYDATTRTATVRRGELGTAPVGHAQFSPAKISPPYPRLDVFRSVAHNIGTLSPSLFTVNSVRMTETSPGVAPLNDPLAASIINITRENRDQLPISSFELVDHDPQTGMRSVRFPPGVGDFWCRYRRRVKAPTSEADTLGSLGMEEMWAPAVVAGAAGEMMVGADLSRTTTEWVTQVLETSGVSVGRRQELGLVLVQYRDLLIDRYRKEMTQEYRSISVSRLSPWSWSDSGMM